MTGFGEAHCQQDGLAVAVEIRTINNRFFKLAVRTSEGYASLEPLVERGAAKRFIAARSRSTSASIAGARPKTTRSTSTCWTAIGGSSSRSAGSGTCTGRCRWRRCLPLAGRGRRRRRRGRRRHGRLAGDRAHAARPPWRTSAACGARKAGPWPPTWRPIAARSPPASTRSSAARRWWSKTTATGSSSG